MVLALMGEEENFKGRVHDFKDMQDDGSRQENSRAKMNMRSMSLDDRVRTTASKPPNYKPIERQQIGSEHNNQDVIMSPVGGDGEAVDPSKQADIDMIKERFSKLLLGEDMSGGGKGVSSALALSNAITNLSASIFGEIARLEPMQPERKARWRKEIDWYLSVTDHIVEFVAVKQNNNGITMEVMTTRQRTDLIMNIPALRKLDAMLIDCLDNFKDQNEFTYVSKNADKKNKRNEDKWWVPTPKVPPNGLSDMTRNWLQFQKESVNQVLKASMAINAQILTEMEIPENYIESLPKKGKTSLGDSVYKSITLDNFDPDVFLTTMDLSTEHKILDLKNRIEASKVIWRRKVNDKNGKSSWSSTVSLEKRELFEERLETILLILKHRFPGIPQSQLDISKIQYNEDVGHAVLESYSRILESLAYKVISRIDDVLHADNLASNRQSSFRESAIKSSQFLNAREELDRLSEGGPISMSLSEFMGCNSDQSTTDQKKDLQDDFSKDGRQGTKKKFLDKLERTGLRSPRPRD
ncbi:Rop guanine nucleotide exchange factor 12 [Heracleum sosnowskyi]|uniref:Rop guanine nucleotide exchange factor 12 n=1 Tax=Heracleum sosnowskyi TaxID=360622 RepID=A0AAD8H359_9APIA|nr:Rop guanine nucleotide exchange factor 12 [Heracleum sosnowskyi]